MELAINAVGAVMVFISSTLVGYYLSLRNDFRATDLHELKRALVILKSEIEFAVNVLPLAFENIASKTQGDVSRFFKAVAVELALNSGTVIAQIWQQKAEVELRISNLLPEDIEQVVQFGKTLGYLDTSLQLRGIDILIQYINKTITELEVESTKNKRMLRSLGVIGGLVVVVVLF